MTAMTQRQRDAMQRAQAGDWELADAMELLDRLQTEGEDADGHALIGGIRQGGARMRLLAYGAMQACPDCDGEGVCSHCAAECSACEGTGEQVPTVAAGITRIVDLNGVLFWASDSGAPAPDVEIQLDQEWARDVLAAYRKAHRDEPAKPATTAPARQRAPFCQTTLIPETT